jgi:hypothetical protein
MLIGGGERTAPWRRGKKGNLAVSRCQPIAMERVVDWQVLRAYPLGDRRGGIKAVNRRAKPLNHCKIERYVVSHAE